MEDWEIPQTWTEEEAVSAAGAEDEGLFVTGQTLAIR